MKSKDNTAVRAFKTKVDRMGEYLAAAGISVPRTHLMECASRYEGARNWRTLRDELSSKQQPLRFPVPSLNGKTVRVYLEARVIDGRSDGPDFAAIDVDQRWIDRVFELRNNGFEYALDSSSDSMEGAEWLDKKDDYFMADDGITVCEATFWYTGFVYGDHKIQTYPIDIDKFVALIQNFKSDELVVTYHSELVKGLMAELGRKKGHPQYINNPGVIVKPSDL